MLTYSSVLSGFRYVSYDLACGSSFSSTTSTLYYISPSLNEVNQWVSTDANKPETVIISGSEPYFVIGDGIPVWWQASDLENLSEAPATLTSTSSSPTSTITSSVLGILPTQTTNILPTQSQHRVADTSNNGGLSTGAKISIGILVPLFVIALVAAIVVYFIRKRMQERSKQTEPTDAMTDELSVRNRELGTEGSVSELYYNNVQESVSHNQNETRFLGLTYSQHSQNNELRELSG
jgi:hypothetical protein